MKEITKPTRFVASRLEAAVLDWAGTTVDFGSRAPIAAILSAFEAAGVPVNEAEARGPMGRAKRDHLAELVGNPAIAARWRQAHGKDPGEAEIDSLYRDFLAVQSECVAAQSGIIDGAVAAIAQCRSLGLAIGATTGYTRELLGPVAARAREEGYEPDVSLCADDLAPGRPAPWLCLEVAKRLGVYPMSAVIKVDDTVAGVTAGRNAGAWSIGVVESGNEVGLTQEALSMITDVERADRLRNAEERLVEAGAHFLVPTIAELPAVVRRINDKLAVGDGP